jgi:hypothetical protein
MNGGTVHEDKEVVDGEIEVGEVDVDIEGLEISDEAGLTTAELLGNAALGVLALVAIWALMQQLGLDIVAWIRSQLIG